MIRDERIGALLAGLSSPCRAAAAPVLRTLIHDLNGALSALVMESFALDQLATKLGQACTDSTQEPKQLEALRDSARNLRQAADDAANYLARVESLTNE